MKKQILTASVFILPLLAAAQVSFGKGAEVFLGKNTELVIEGDLEGQENIEGDGIIVLNGKKVQTIDLGGKSMPQLLIENNEEVALLSGLKIKQELALKRGHLLLNEHNLELGVDAVAKGSASSYIITNGSGKVIKPLNYGSNHFMLPVGTVGGFLPLLIKAGEKYTNGVVEIAARSTANPHKPLSSRDYLQNYWVINNRSTGSGLIATAFITK